jgi:UDP-2-acetamido-2,6-beta-L-arabino-hexul-4-ose reductase
MNTIKLRERIDQRGNLVENTKEQVMLETRHFFVSKSIPGVIRGNHYHKRKKEYFLVIQGMCEIVMKDLINNKVESIKVSSRDNVLVLVEPNKAHAIRNIGDIELILLALVNEPLDQKNPDTYPYKVI